MNIRFHRDPDTDLPHVFQHGVSESELMEAIEHPLENRGGSGNSSVVIGRTRTGRLLRIIAVFDDDAQGVFVITAYDLRGKPLRALRRRMRRGGQR